MTEPTAGSLTLQFLMHGYGTAQDHGRAEHLATLLGDALARSGSGALDGSDSGSGTMNVFFALSDASAGREVVMAALGSTDQLTDLVLAFRTSEAGEDADDEIWWPEGYPYVFTVFGPAWKGPLADADREQLSEAERDLQGLWRLVAYDSPSGERVQMPMQFLIVGDRLTVRQGAGVASDARFRVDDSATPAHLDMVPLMGPNRGVVSYGVYQIENDHTLHLLSHPPGEERPTHLADPAAHQSGRMILQREEWG